MSILPPRPLLAATLLLLGGLAWTVEGRPVPDIGPAEAARWEGQAVQVEGWVQDVTQREGSVRFALAEGPDAVAVRLPAAAHGVVHGGERVAVTGRLMRATGGDLLLLADDAASLRRLAGPSASDPGWDAVSGSPVEWTGRPLRLEGTVERGALHGPGGSITLGDGPWPSSGAVEATGFLRFDAACVCFVLDASQVRPWTS